MINLNYTYIKPAEIFSDIKFIIDFSPFEFIALFVLSILLFLVIIYILPLLYIKKEKYIIDKKKKDRKLLLKQIIMQKELEDEIMKEIKKH